MRRHVIVLFSWNLRRDGRSSNLRFALRLRPRVPRWRSRVPAWVLRSVHPRSVASRNDRLTVDTSLTMHRAPCYCWEPRERARLAIVGASRRLSSSFSLPCPCPFSPVRPSCPARVVLMILRRSSTHAKFAALFRANLIGRSCHGARRVPRLLGNFSAAESGSSATSVQYCPSCSSFLERETLKLR